jgi:alpha-N-arabinofuranosidase
MRRYTNPILSGFHPDPTICRVGDDYYLVNSSFEYCPGLPIFQSRDLIHWRLIGHALTRPTQLFLQDSRPSGGIYAPTLRFHQGTFYLITTNVSHKGNFVITAADPAGPWSDPVWIENAEGIDPSLFFDDNGRCYYVGNGNPEHSLYDGHHTIWLQEMDLTSLQLIGDKRVIVDGGSDISKKPIWIEGPHLYKIDGRYYLFAAEGGTEENHSEVVFRSEKVTGPYESFTGNPILTNRDIDQSRPFPITCTGHADLVQTQIGEWWMVLLACRPYAPFDENYFNIGRETFLIPISWQDGWPIVADGSRRVTYSYPAPELPESLWNDGYGDGNFAFREEFEKPNLPGIWNTIREPGDDWHSLTARPGYLRIQPRLEELTGPGSPSFVGVRQRHISFTAETAMEFEPSNEWELAGLAVQQNNRAYYALVCGRSGDKHVVRLMKKSADGALEVRYEAAVSSGPIHFKVAAKGRDYSFFYREQNEPWRCMANDENGRILSTRSAGGFVGAYIGLYATSSGQSSTNHADFDGFSYQGQDEIFESNL